MAKVAKDSVGLDIQVGDTIMVMAKVVDVVDESAGANIVAVTAVEHGEEKKVYSIPCIHGSQVRKV